MTADHRADQREEDQGENITVMRFKAQWGDQKVLETRECSGSLPWVCLVQGEGERGEMMVQKRARRNVASAARTLITCKAAAAKLMRFRGLVGGPK